MLLRSFFRRKPSLKMRLINVLFIHCSSRAPSIKKKAHAFTNFNYQGSKHWEHNQEVKAILKSFKPNNDICERILGLKNYLSTTLPNLHQMSQSNLFKKTDKALQWLDTLPSEQQSSVVELARKSRVQVRKACKEAELEKSKLRQEKMMGGMSKRCNC